ncbi:STAS domain-containing protein [Nonomuraea cavernae]|uniref:STAS domain-containing protein n=1 Tax=Nonomuraea cavernae TaxID=2045107 RepID=UPI0033F15CF2
MNTTDPIAAFTPSTAADRRLRITPLADLAGLRIEGELDRATLPTLVRTLASIAGHTSFCIDLSGLMFCDVGGLRCLLTAAVGLPDGHVLTLRSPSPQVRRLLELTNWAQTAGF